MSIESPPNASGPQLSRNYQLIEVLVFLFLIVPSMVLSFFVVRVGTLSFNFVAFSTILRDLGLVGLILLFLWRNGEPLSRLGWSFAKPRTDIILGVVLFFPLFSGADFLERGLQALGFTVPATPRPAFLGVQGPAEAALGLILVAVVAWAEETIFRGYLMLRFRELNLGPLAAALLSSAVFALGHGYEGSAGVITVGAMGFAFALVYLWRGSLLTPMVMHFVQDFSAIVLPAFLGVK